MKFNTEISVTCLKMWGVGLSLWLLSDLSSAVEIVIGRYIPLKAGESYTLEVARDESFQQLTYKKVFTNHPLLISVNSEGVYHWRLLPFDNSDSNLKSTSMSGSFVVVFPHNSSYVDPVTLSWAQETKATHFIVSINNAKGVRLVNSQSVKQNLIKINRSSELAVIQVEPYSGGRRLYEGFYRVRGLAMAGISGDVKPSQSLPTHVQATKVVNPQEDVTSESINEQALKSDPADQEQDLSLPRHRVIVYESLFLHSLEAKKGTNVITGSNQSVGLGIKFFASPRGRFYLGGSYDYHDFETMGEIETPGGSQDRYIETSSFNFNIYGGLNLLALFSDQKTHFFGLNVTGSLIQTPSIPLETGRFDLIEDKLNIESYFLGGGGVQYRYMHKQFSFVLQGGAQFTDKKEAFNTLGEMTLEFYLNKFLALDFSLGYREFVFEDCHESEVICVLEGDVKTTNQEIMISLGLGIYR